MHNVEAMMLIGYLLLQLVV